MRLSSHWIKFPSIKSFKTDSNHSKPCFVAAHVKRASAAYKHRISKIYRSKDNNMSLIITPSDNNNTIMAAKEETAAAATTISVEPITVMSETDLSRQHTCTGLQKLPNELLYQIIETLIFELVRKADFLNRHITNPLKTIHNLSLVSRTFHDIVTTTFTKVVVDWFPNNLPREINLDFDPLDTCYALMHKPWLPISVLSRLLTLNLERSADQRYGLPGTNVVFTSWDPVTLSTLLLIWDRQAGFKDVQVPCKSIRLRIWHSDSIAGHKDDRILRKALTQIRNIDFAHIHLYLPEKSLYYEDALTLKDAFRVTPVDCVITQSEADGEGAGFLNAIYTFKYDGEKRFSTSYLSNE